jgi:hypothetical protein
MSTDIILKKELSQNTTQFQDPKSNGSNRRKKVDHVKSFNV